MKLSDCFVLPSFFEGCSIAALEAMYLGLPLILSDVGAARDLIENGDIGIIIPNAFSNIDDISYSDIMSEGKSSFLNNVDALVNAMIMIGKDRQGWRLRARAGRDKIVKGYSAKRMSDDYISCFREVMGSRMERANGIEPS